MQKRFILASSSPRRKELLEAAGLSFETVSPRGDEVKCADSPELVALNNAVLKAREVASLESAAGAFVLGSDTIVVSGARDNREILGKPTDESDALRMLSMLNGTAHTVISGYCIITPDKTEISETVSTLVTFKQNDLRTIEDYIASGEPFDKAGGYAVQGLGGSLVQSIDGDLNNVIGLPSAAIERIKELLL